MNKEFNVKKAGSVLVILVVGLIVGGTQARIAAGQVHELGNTLRSAEKLYVCPMHTEIKSTRPGKCRKCGMDLRLTRDETGSANTSRSGSNNISSEPAQNAALASDSESRSPARKMVIPDVEVLDQHGNQLHFYSDLIKGKTVAINFIFTNCTTICPPLAATFARVQRDMGDKVGRDVHLISISVDPLTDTPERLKAWGGKFKAGAGWTFVTGNKQEIDKLLNALDASVARREDHSPAVIVGNDSKDIWTRTYGLAKTSQIVGLILNVMEGKTDESLIKEMGKP